VIEAELLRRDPALARGRPAILWQDEDAEAHKMRIPLARPDVARPGAGL
jgi:hypothetical protein